MVFSPGGIERIFKIFLTIGVIIIPIMVTIVLCKMYKEANK